MVISTGITVIVIRVAMGITMISIAIIIAIAVTTNCYAA
jgi:hypothetical protein